MRRRTTRPTIASRFKNESGESLEPPAVMSGALCISSKDRATVGGVWVTLIVRIMYIMLNRICQRLSRKIILTA